MAFICSVERIGMRKGMEKGVGKLLLDQLVYRFGKLPEPVVARVKAGTPEELGEWGRRVLSAPSLDAVFGDEPSAATH